MGTMIWSHWSNTLATVTAKTGGLAGLLLVFFVLGSSLRVLASDAAAHPEMLVSTEWLASHLNDPKVIVVQAGNDGRDYDKEHIPGARFLSSQDFTTGNEGLMVELPTVDKLKRAFEELGVSDDTRVVIY